MPKPKKPVQRRPWQEVWPAFANRQSLQDAQDQFDLVEGNPKLAKAIREREAFIDQIPRREYFDSNKEFKKALRAFRRR